MKFTPESLTRCAARLGSISKLERIPDIILETPLVMLYTKRGSVPHITKDVLEMITKEKELLTVSLPSTFTMTDPVKQFKSIADFIGLKEYPVFLTIQDSAEKTASGYNEKDTVAIWMRHGKQLINPDQYMDVVESFRPDFYMALSDGDTNLTSSLKRVKNSLGRSEKMFEKCFARHKESDVIKNKGIIGPIEGGYSKEARTKSIEYLKRQDLHGFVIDGLHNNGPEIENIDFGEIEEIVKHTINLLPEEKMRVSMGAWNPVTVIKLVELGIDLFDSCYPYFITERSCALTFLCEHSISDDDSPMISVAETRYRDDFTPICKSCECLTCKNHTRAYLNHLHHTKELLGKVLLMIHNTHHYLEYFKEIRESLRNDTFKDLEIRIGKKFSKKGKNDLAN